MSRETGFIAEDTAKAYLIAQGLKWVCSHYQCRYGEIDLIMREARHLVFVEVKFRKGGTLAEALESVTHTKQQKLRITATHYLSACRGHLSEQARFDVIILLGTKIEWIQDAFR